MSDREEFKIRRKRFHRKRHFSGESEDELSEQRRLMANSQERVRMQRINVALEDLKQVLPEEYHPCRRRMSKIRTLRSAMEYISNLSKMLEQDNERRRMLYLQAKEYVACVQQECKSVYGEDANINLYQTPTLTTFYPYLGPLCMDFIGPATQTFEQTPQKQTAATSRQLHFNAPTKRIPPQSDVDITPDFITAGRLRNACDETPTYRKSCPVMSTPTNRKSCSVTSSATFPSPFHDIRNESQSDAVSLIQPVFHESPLRRTDTSNTCQQLWGSADNKQVVDLCDE